MIKDEQPYLREWIEYHYRLGFNKIYLIEDYNSTSHQSITDNYNYVELHKLIDVLDDEEIKMLNDGIYRHCIVYHTFHRLWRHDNDWMAYIDADEYIDTEKELLLHFLKRCFNDPTVTMRWKNMKCDGHIEHPNHWNEYSLIDTYKTFNFNISQVKQLINCKRRFDDYLKLENWKNIPHQLSPSQNNYKYDIYLKHFLCKSFEEWVYRLANKGEMTSACWNRSIDNWFLTNPEFINQRDELISKYVPQDFKVKINNFTI